MGEGILEGGWNIWGDVGNGHEMDRRKGRRRQCVEREKAASSGDDTHDKWRNRAAKGRGSEGHEASGPTV